MAYLLSFSRFKSHKVVVNAKQAKAIRQIRVNQSFLNAVRKKATTSCVKGLVYEKNKTNPGSTAL